MIPSYKVRTLFRVASGWLLLAESERHVKNESGLRVKPRKEVLFLAHSTNGEEVDQRTTVFLGSRVGKESMSLD